MRFSLRDQDVDSGIIDTHMDPKILNPDVHISLSLFILLIFFNTISQLNTNIESDQIVNITVNTHYFIQHFCFVCGTWKWKMSCVHYWHVLCPVRFISHLFWLNNSQNKCHFIPFQKFFLLFIYCYYLTITDFILFRLLMFLVLLFNSISSNNLLKSTEYKLQLLFLDICKCFNEINHSQYK